MPLYDAHGHELVAGPSPQVVASVQVIDAHFTLFLALATADTEEATAFQ